MGKFDFLDAALNESSKAHMLTDKMIDIDDIEPYPLNDVIYPPEQYEEYMEQLIEDIRERGLQQTVELIPHPTKPGKYYSIGGNRRCAAIRHLVNDEKLEKFRMVKSTISEKDPLEAGKDCIMSNGHRDKTDYTKIQEIKYLINYKKENEENWQRDSRKYKSIDCSRN